MIFAKTLVTLTAVLASTVAALAQDEGPAVIFDRGGKFDKSFNEATYNGAERFRTETGIGYAEFEVQQDAQREQALRRFAERGNNPIVAAGFSSATAVQTVAAEFPETQFAIIDAVVDLPNVRSVIFKEQEGSYLVGVLAALASKSGKVGFVGGMDIPLIQKFACGYVQGVKATKPEAEVFQNMTGNTPEAWNDRPRGAEIARSQIDRGADVIYHAAGGTGIGVLEAAADAGVLGIGVDSNQNMLHPGKVLTSMLKRVDNAVHDALADSNAGDWTSGLVVMGLKEDGVGWALDENNAALITPEMQAAADEARAKIISGEIVVHDYSTDGACPAS